MRAHVYLLTLMLVIGCTSSGTPEKASDENLVEVGDMISVNYIGRVGTTVFDTNIEAAGKAAGLDKVYAPLKFKVGAGHMIDGFDKGVVWMRKGETKELIIPPVEGYGLRQEELVKVFPVREDFSAAVGEGVEFQMDDQSIRGVVMENNGTHMVIDFNFPLSGQTLIFEVTVLDIEKAA